MATSLTPQQLAEISNAEDAAEDLARYGQTCRVCLACGGPLAMERNENSYRILCAAEGRVLLTSRGL